MTEEKNHAGKNTLHLPSLTPKETIHPNQLQIIGRTLQLQKRENVQRNKATKKLDALQ
jgi:hypothetical protein